ncbi:hypothetical protein FGO68_gene728 [Halteria grandinella]|uniref:Histidine kinase n=1 Tax=Halteria grandinella TaxID=5974 RepID=A0A8J8P078_HALGN|nr:hypothetical protein FGO68_gene728 [Halteria grandinella]
MRSLLADQEIDNQKQSSEWLKQRLSQFNIFEEFETNSTQEDRRPNGEERVKANGNNLWEFIVKMSKKKDTIEEQEQIFKRKLKSKTFIQVKCALTNNGRQLMAICTDITRIKQVEQQGRRMRASFFSSVAHELRTPLNSIIPMLSMILEMIKPMQQLDRVKKYLQIVRNSSMHLQTVIEDALDVTRIENNKFCIYQEHFDIRKAVQEVTEIMSFQIEQKGLQQVVEFDRSVPDIIFSDCKRFKQVLFNLIGNAVKFTFGGSINVSLRFLKQTLTCTVRDTGIGIQSQDQKKLFKFFGTLAKSKDINRGGMGLGLTISKMIVQSLGGDITLTSQTGVGSVFTFSIPIEVKEEDQPIKQRQTSFSPLKQELKAIQNIIQISSNQIQFSDQSGAVDSESVDGEGTVREKSQCRKALSQLYPDLKIYKISGAHGANQRSHLVEEDQSYIEEIKLVTHDNIAKTKILCVDDSTYNLFVIKELISSIDQSIHVDTALNGKIALELLNKNKLTQYNLVLMDLNMPVMDGFQAAKCARENPLISKVKIVAISAITKHQFHSNPFSHYFNGFIEKPICRASLFQAIYS